MGFNYNIAANCYVIPQLKEINTLCMHIKMYVSIHSRAPLDSNLEAVLTVSPKRQ